MPLAGRFLLLVLGIAAVVAAVAVPRNDEWLAVLNDDRRQAEIIAQLEPRLERDGTDPALLATLGRAYADAGETARATPLLERYLAIRPADGDARRRLAALYRTAGTEEKERAALAGLGPELTVANGLLLRLARLQQAAGEAVAGAALLSRPEVIQPPAKPAGNAEERLLLAALLAEAGQGAQSVRLGLAWVPQWRDPWLSTRLLLAVAPHAAVAEVAALADAVASAHPEIRLYLAGQLAGAGAPAPARQLLRGWQPANPRPDAASLLAFLDACARWGDPAIAWDAFAQTLRSGAEPEIAARYADAFAAAFGIGALAPFWSALPPGTLARSPLLAARLAFAAGDPARAYHLAASLDPTALPAGEQELWADLVAATSPPGALLALLQSMQGRGPLPRALALRHTRLARGGLQADAGSPAGQARN